MQTFLQQVACDLYAKYGADLSRTAIVFPNKRAGLFFNEALAAQADRPMWAPAYLSISDLFCSLSPWQAGDSIRLVCELYKVFVRVTGSKEPLDDFYFWGELLISDFDDLDKNQVPADRLFGNLQDLKDLADDPTFLSTGQGEAIRRFFLNFSPERRTELKERFLSLWDKLGDIYRAYREILQGLGIAYEGMLQRDALERLDPQALPFDRYVFVGFNVLNRVSIGTMTIPMSIPMTKACPLPMRRESSSAATCATFLTNCPNPASTTSTEQTSTSACCPRPPRMPRRASCPNG